MARTMTALILFATAAMAVAAKPADLIVGKWEGEGGSVSIKPEKGEKKTYTRKATVEFRKDGTMTVTEGEIAELKEDSPDIAKGYTQEAAYTFVKDDEIEMKPKGTDEKIRIKVSIKGDELTVTMPGENVTKKMKRVKE